MGCKGTRESLTLRDTGLDLEPLQYRETRQWKYETAADYRVRLPIKPEKDIKTTYIQFDRFGNLLIREGYGWDGASGPTLDTRRTMIPSLIHDALYQLMRMGLLPESERAAADAILREAMIACGAAPWRARLWYWMVRPFAAGAARKRGKYDEQTLILTAP